MKLYLKSVLVLMSYSNEHPHALTDLHCFAGANILLDNSGHVKLADFGASKKIESLATVGRHSLIALAKASFRPGLFSLLL